MTEAAQPPTLTIGDTFVDAPRGVIEIMLTLFFRDNPMGTFAFGSVEDAFHVATHCAADGVMPFEVPLDEPGSLPDKVWEAIRTMSDVRHLVEGRVIVGDIDNAIAELRTALPQCDFTLTGSREFCSVTLQIKPSLALVPLNRREQLHCTLDASMAATLREVMARAIEVGAFGAPPALAGS